VKKKISLLGLVLILVLGMFTGCGKSETTEYDQAALEQYADFILQNFSAMSPEQMESFQDMSELELDLTLINAGVPISGENFLTMMDAWNAALEECGTFIDRGDYTMEVTNDGPVLNAEVNFSDRDAAVEFAFDDKGSMESLTVSAEYTTGEILQKAGLNTVLGMGTTFVVLIFLSFIIWLLKYIPVLEKKFRKSPETAAVPAAAPAPVQTAPIAGETPEGPDAADDTELAAVIAAAVAAAEGTSPDGFVVRSIKRRKSNKWN